MIFFSAIKIVSFFFLYLDLYLTLLKATDDNETIDIRAGFK